MSRSKTSGLQAFKQMNGAASAQPPASEPTEAATVTAELPLEEVDPPAPAPPAKAVEPPREPGVLLSLLLPLGKASPGAYVKRHTDVQLSLAQAQTMKCLLEGLQDKGARLANERRVTTYADCVRYLLEQIAVNLELAGTD